MSEQDNVTTNTDTDTGPTVSDWENVPSFTTDRLQTELQEIESDPLWNADSSTLSREDRWKHKQLIHRRGMTLLKIQHEAAASKDTGRTESFDSLPEYILKAKQVYLTGAPADTIRSQILYSDFYLQGPLTRTLLKGTARALSLASRGLSLYLVSSMGTDKSCWANYCLLREGLAAGGGLAQSFSRVAAAMDDIEREIGLESLEPLEVIGLKSLGVISFFEVFDPPALEALSDSLKNS